MHPDQTPKQAKPANFRSKDQKLKIDLFQMTELVSILTYNYPERLTGARIKGLWLYRFPNQRKKKQKQQFLFLKTYRSEYMLICI